jgi:peptidoglycan hydrolase CwlO-like protein
MALAILGAALTVGTLAALGVQAAPSTPDDQRAQIRALEAEVQGIDTDAAAAADAHAAALARERELEDGIARTGRELAAAREARREAVRRLSERLVAIYRSEPPSLVEILLTSGDLTAAVDAQTALETIGDADRGIVDRLDATRARLTALAAQLRQDRAAAQANVAATRERRDRLDGLIARRRAVLDQAQARLDTIIASRARARAAAAARARDERTAEGDLRRRAAGEAPADPAPAPARAPSAPASSAIPADVAAHLERIAQCESGGDPTRDGGQYRGKYQFDLGTWQSVGGTGDPAAAPEAEQDRRAAMLYALRGSSPWPVCQYR